MEKKNIKLAPISNEKCFLSGNEIEILSYIPQEIITNYILPSYMDSIFSDPANIAYGYINAENIFAFNVITHCTNVDISAKDKSSEEITEIIEGMYSSGLWDLVRNKIRNYSDVRCQIERAVELTIKERNNWEHILKALNQWLSEQLNSDKVKELASDLKKESENLSKFYPTVKTEELKADKPKRARKAKQSDGQK